ncbi:NUDIX hydrolase [Cellulomonas dongxiuzhuiae]|uniref:NUDIX hydrolase n=1 Tax=Cellulomonas dongxiuzhuiae TaxID=2819979 RepID=UPI001AB0041A|nr:CoA pyrophosphatase [Cellulomonas dongxiuzhuiae]MBO3087328.1 CoA pyrophosphatase [Cellulomonas dongxiuzhuiae]
MTPRSVADARADLVRVAREGVVWPGVPPRRDDGTPPARRSAVLVLFGVLDAVPAHGDTLPVPAELDVLLHRRAATLAHHPGQVAFPGGGIDPQDDGPVGAALREAVEETGLDPSGVDVLGTLADVPVPVSDNLVTPVLAWWSVPSPVVAVDHREAVDVFRAPVADLVDPARRGVVVHAAGRGRARTPAFELDGGVVVWGFTALVLAGVLDAAGWSVPWDRSRVVSP